MKQFSTPSRCTHPDEFEKHVFSGQTAGWSPQMVVYIVSKRIPPKNSLNSGLGIIVSNLTRFLAQGSYFCCFPPNNCPRCKGKKPGKNQPTLENSSR